MKNMDRSRLRGPVKKAALGMVGDLEIIYRLLDWRWHDKKTTPTKEELLETIMELFDGAMDCKGYASTGGLCVGLDKEAGEEDGVISISFEWDRDVSVIEEK